MHLYKECRINAGKMTWQWGVTVLQLDRLSWPYGFKVTRVASKQTFHGHQQVSSATKPKRALPLGGMEASKSKTSAKKNAGWKFIKLATKNLRRKLQYGCRNCIKTISIDMITCSIKYHRTKKGLKNDRYQFW